MLTKTLNNKFVFLERVALFAINHKKYYKFSLFRSVSPDDLWKAMRKALNDSNIEQDEWDIEKVMSSWLTSSNYPVLNVAYYPAFQVVILYREIFQNQGNTRDLDYTRWIPVTYATKSKPYFNKTLPEVWLPPKTRSLQIDNISNDSDDWVIFNLQQTGKYCIQIGFWSSFNNCIRQFLVKNNTSNY